MPASVQRLSLYLQINIFRSRHFMLNNKLYPYALVIVQLSCLVYIFTSGPWLASGYAGILIESMGIFLGIVAIFVNGIGNFNISPKLKENGKLITSGPYSFIRHPMYSAQLIAVLPLVIDQFDYLRLGAFLLLLCALLLKISFEEKSLSTKYPEYITYARKTHRLVPFVY